MIDGMFVFDCVIHAYDLSDTNLHAGERNAEVFRDHLLRVGAQSRPEAADDYDFGGRWSAEAVYKLVFEDAPTDMAMAQTVPIFDWFEDFFAPARAQYELAQRYPQQVLFCGGVDPLHRGLEAALDGIEFQIRELGAVSMKFYNGHVPKSWRCDDESVAYPLYERCRELGVRVLQFHKGLPLGLQNLEDLSPVDLQAAARDFPDMTFVIHHLGLPFFDETVSIAARFDNVYLALSGNINHALIAPRLVQERLGRLLQEVGSEKLLWGSEAALAGSPAPYLREFLKLEIPDDLRSGFGYPQITRADRERILGVNFARIMGIDVPAPTSEQLAPASGATA